MSARILDDLLRAPARIADDCRSSERAKAIVATSLVALAVGSAIFGAVVGSINGGRQIAFAALKMPLALMGTLVVCAPAFYAISAVFGRALRFRAVIAIAAGAGARASLVLLASAPVLWLAIDLGAPYHAVKLLAAAAYAVAGLAALRLLVRALGDGPGKIATIASVLVVFLLVGSQTAWVLRPYLGRPGETIPLFTSEREGGLVVQILESVRRVGAGGAGASRP
jgi:hypothetical protein